MTQALGTLADRVAGAVIRPGDEGYEEARRVNNAMVDVRPAAIVRCATADDVVEVIRLAAEKRMDLAVRGGGHSVPGFGTAEGAIVADLSPMQSCTSTTRPAPRRPAAGRPGAASTT
jgi:FAD/FMN-containing dehydrogenase